MKFKGVENNSRIRAIGSLFRRLHSSDWHINVILAPGQRKRYFGISQAPILARRRVLNPTETARPAGFLSNVATESTNTWKSALIKTCPIPAVSRQEDAQQWCFVFQNNQVAYYLPQLELARVLFFHHAYLARLSLIHQGLAQEFDIQRMSGMSKALINIMPTCTLPLHVRGDHALRRVLAWILLDDEARQSYESIARYQLQHGYDNENYRLWCFQFDPPRLEGTELTLRGHYDQEINAFFVYEVYGVSNLTCNCPAYVEFIDPRYLDKQPGQGHSVRSGTFSIPALEIDDEQVPDSDQSEIPIDIPMVAFEFANPFHTTRVGKGKRHSGSKGHEGDDNTSSTETGLNVSTDEASIQGTLPPADYEGLEDKSDDAHLYANKFEAFEAMVAQLVRMPNCSHIRREIRKLSWIEGYSKHLLADGNPRCLAFHLINKGGVVHALLEVDTSDNKNCLSSLLLKQHASVFYWDRQLSELEIRLLKGSLVWPTSFLKQAFGSDFKRISHQRSSSTENTAMLEQESINRWAERVHSEMFAL